jgi:hypothetical protein
MHIIRAEQELDSARAASEREISSELELEIARASRASGVFTPRL